MLYIDDVEMIYNAMSDVCAEVEMESDEFSNITLQNIEAIRQEKLTGFTFRGYDPHVVVSQLLHCRQVYVSLTAGGASGEQLFAHLVGIFKQKRRRVLGIPANVANLTTLIALVGAVLLGVGIAGILPEWVANVAVGLTVAASFGVTLVGDRPVIVRPIWKRDAAPGEGINSGTSVQLPPLRGVREAELVLVREYCECTQVQTLRGLFHLYLLQPIRPLG